MEIVVAAFEGIEQILVGAYFHAGGGLELIEVLYVIFVAVYGECLVGAECRQDLDAESASGDFLVVFEIARGVVGSTDDFHSAVGHALSRRQPPREDGVCPVPNLLRRIAREQQVVDSEKPRQLQMAPVVHRVAEHPRHGLRELLEFLPVGGVAGAEALVHAVGAHGAPLVVVGAEPRLGDVVPFFVLPDFPGVEMAVKVYQRKLLRIAVVKLAREIVFEEKIVVNKFFH